MLDVMQTYVAVLHDSTEAATLYRLLVCKDQGALLKGSTCFTLECQKLYYRRSQLRYYYVSPIHCNALTNSSLHSTLTSSKMRNIL